MDHNAGRKVRDLAALIAFALPSLAAAQAQQDSAFNKQVDQGMQAAAAQTSGPFHWDEDKKSCVNDYGVNGLNPFAVKDLGPGVHAECANLKNLVLPEGISYLGDANFKGADLTGARLDGVRLSSADFTGAKLISAHLQSADLYRAVFDDADLTQARMAGANVKEATFNRFTSLPKELDPKQRGMIRKG